MVVVLFAGSLLPFNIPSFTSLSIATTTSLLLKFTLQSASTNYGADSSASSISLSSCAFFTFANSDDMSKFVGTIECSIVGPFTHVTSFISSVVKCLAFTSYW